MTTTNLPDPMPDFYDCGCSDIYFCPASEEVECPRHSGFNVCCAEISRHIPVRTHTASA
ncbi:hypothetical protein [Nonomuraea marmarensis]|uniref:hypothetical protein n=1 Tax=Nonomuraea marmarensis TaxID=3351344 RepID=UPI00371AC0AC